MKYDCFAMKAGECQALTETQCQGCSFYKPVHVYESDLLSALMKFSEMREDPRKASVYKDNVDRYFGSGRTLQSRISQLEERLGGSVAPT